MKKRYVCILCSLLLLFSGCTSTYRNNTISEGTTTSPSTIIPNNASKYQRISLKSDTLGEALIKHISKDTEVVCTADQDFPTQVPIYEITERMVSEQEFQQMQQQLEISNNPSSGYDDFELDGNIVYCNLASYTDFSRGYFDMADEELEIIAWETFNKIPFIEGDYEYLGIQSTTTVIDAEGEHITRAGVSFRRLLDGMRIVGEENCMLYFDGSGLVCVQMSLFDYEKIGTMDVVALENAKSQIKTPDAFILEAENESELSDMVQTLCVDRANLLWVNQHSNGCTILQPIYNFTGIATDTVGAQTEFSSRIIAIPESYTYETK